MRDFSCEAEAKPFKLSPPRIVCAANRYYVFGRPLVIPSARHLDMRMRELVMSLGLTGSPDEEQGFIDQHGRFYTREEAWPIAFANGQVVRRVGGDEGRLYSENLY